MTDEIPMRPKYPHPGYCRDCGRRGEYRDGETCHCGGAFVRDDSVEGVLANLMVAAAESFDGGSHLPNALALLAEEAGYGDRVVVDAVEVAEARQTSDEDDDDGDAKAVLPDGGTTCTECGASLPEEIDEGTGVYCSECGHGQLVTDGGQTVNAETVVLEALATFDGAAPRNRLADRAGSTVGRGTAERAIDELDRRGVVIIVDDEVRRVETDGGVDVVCRNDDTVMDRRGEGGYVCPDCGHLAGVRVEDGGSA